jgi:hypothetical protein
MRPTALLLLAALGATGCSGAQTKLDAAEDVRAFIVAVRENDRAGFEKHIDRPALRTQVLSQVQAAMGDSPLTRGAFAEQAVDEMIRPETLRKVLEQSGAPQRTPTAPEIATQLRTEADGRVCIPSAPEGPCAATFARTGDVWRLVAVDARAVGL